MHCAFVYTLIVYTYSRHRFRLGFSSNRSFFSM